MNIGDCFKWFVLKGYFDMSNIEEKGFRWLENRMGDNQSSYKRGRISFNMVTNEMLRDRKNILSLLISLVHISKWLILKKQGFTDFLIKIYNDASR